MIIKIKPSKVRKDRVEQFYEVFGYTIRNQIIIELMIKGELTITELELFLVNTKRNKITKASRKAAMNNLSKMKKPPIHRRTLNNHLTENRLAGIVNYRKDGLKCYWYLKEHELVHYIRDYLTDKPIRRKHHTNSVGELWEELSNNFEIGERFKVKLLRERCNVPTLSNARLSQLLKELSNTPLLTKVSHGVNVREMNSEEE